MTEYWERPNWRNPEEYEMPEDLSLHQWYWQFLRRRRDYIADYWKHADETYETCCKAYGKDEIENIFRPKDENFVSSIPTAYHKYNIISCPNPRNNQPFDFIYSADKTVSMMLGEEGTPEFPIELWPHQAVVTFNLQLPISQQIKDAQKMLLTWQHLHAEKTGGACRKIQFRRHTDLWPSYLRAIDASDQGEILEDIGLVLTTPCLSEEGMEDHLIATGSKKLKGIGKATIDAARKVQFNFPF